MAGFPPSGTSRMQSLAQWRLAIRHAQNVPQVQRILQEYLDSIPASEMSRLSQECQRAATVSDIPGAAVYLLRAELAFRGEEESAHLLHELAHTFIAASQRIGVIEAGQATGRHHPGRGGTS
jgi:hypothetical protein